MSRWSPPAGIERWVVAGAAATWLGVGAGARWGMPAVMGGALMAAVAMALGHGTGGRLALVALAGVLAGWSGSGRPVALAPEASGPITLEVAVVADGRPSSYDGWALVRPRRVEVDGVSRDWRGPVGLVSHPEAPEWRLGDRLRLTGSLLARQGRAAGEPYAWRMRPRSIEHLGRTGGPFVAGADWVRGRIGRAVDHVADRSAAALVTGFLIGDVRELADPDRQAMRAAGLSHFVAVSGSNVALFLLLWWVLLAPLAGRPPLRAIGGIVGLILFTFITRWEPSVVRAATMAGLVLAGRLASIPVTVWNALGGATAVILILSPELAGDVGFQLSVAATAGVVAGSRMFDGVLPRWVAAPLGVTVAAQLAVAPILLTVFGSLPLWSPIANLIAAPLVTASTIVGGIGAALGLAPLVDLAVGLAVLVLRVAHAVAGMPQVGWPGALGVAVLAGLAAGRRRLRPAVALAAVVVLGLGVAPGAPIAGPVAVFLDVGQGDAILLRGAGGGTVLVDGGRDPTVLLARLDRHGIDRLDLVVSTHPDDDHIGGLIELVGRRPVGRLWYADPHEASPRLDELLAAAAAAGVPVEVPGPGTVVAVGGVRLEVLGPLRRYAATNDEGLVAVATIGGRRVFLTGDIEETAQRETGMPSVDILKVPHHGSRTTDLDWLATTDAALAVITVGENDFGHPAPEVLAVLEGAGVEVRRTDLEGDIVVRMDP